MPESITIEELKNVIEIIVSKISVISSDKRFTTSLHDFLLRFISKNERDITKNELELKIGRQLLCSICIDIEFDTVPSVVYLNIFKKIDFNDFSMPARLLFANCIKKYELFHRGDLLKEDNQEYATVFPLNDWHYYISPKELGLIGKRQLNLAKRRLNRLIRSKTKRRVPVTCQVFYKHSKNNYFWLCTYNELSNILKDTSLHINNVVDKLGLSHFDYSVEEAQHFYFLQFEGLDIDVYKPNATLVDWSNPKLGFLSFKGGIGKTFSVTGFSNYSDGVGERIFHKLELSDENKRKVTIGLFDDKIIPPIEIEPNDIVQEGIIRSK